MGSCALSIGAKINDLGWPLSDIQGHGCRKCCKIDKTCPWRWSNTSKMIQRLISLVFSVCKEHNSIDLLQWEQSEISFKTGIRHMTCYILNIQCETKKIPPWGVLTFFIFFTNGWEFLIDCLLTYYTFLSTLDYKFLFNYRRFWRSYAILSATTQFT